MECTLDPENDFTGGLVLRHYLVYTNPQLPSPINQHINSYGGK